MVGYSRLMEADEAGTFERLRSYRQLLVEPEIEKHHGRIFKLMGDGLLAEFASVVEAVECAVVLQRQLAERNEGVAEARRIDVRMGINLGDVIVEEEDRHGEGVVIAARLQQLADPGGIAVSGTVADHVRHKMALRFEPLGSQQVKNIAEPVVVYRIRLDPIPAALRRQRTRSRWWSLGGALALLLAAGAGFGWHFSGILRDVIWPRAGQGIPVVVVLPFRDLTGGPTETDLGAGIAEAFTTELANFPDFEVVSSTSAFAYAGRPVPEIVKATGALFLIEGSIRRSADKVDVTMQLIRGDTDRHLKIAQIEENMKDPVALQAAVADRLRDELGGMTGILRKEYNAIALAKPEADRTEYDYYILGHIHSLCEDGEGAGAIWKQGLARYPKSPLLHYKLMIYYLDRSEEIGEATRLYNEAESLERKSRLDEWYRHWLAAWLHSNRGETQSAVAEARAAIAMAPYDAISHNNLSWVMREAGEMDEAIAYAKFAVTHDPNMHEFYFHALTRAYRAADKWPDGVTLGEAQIVTDPLHAKWWYEFLDQAYQATGQWDKAIEAQKKAAGLPDPPEDCPTPG